MSAETTLDWLNVFAGEWEFRLIVGGKEASRGSTKFEWMPDGAFLLQRANSGPTSDDAPPEWAEHLPFPVVAVLGLDDAGEEFTMLYSDARGVRRVYRMTIEGRDWTVWREAAGFNQRFVATFSQDGNRIEGHWDFSEDGETWSRDFDMTYTRVR